MLATVHLTLNNHVVNMWCPCYMILFCSKTFYSFLSSPMINVVTISLDVTDVTDHFHPNPRVLKIERCEIIKKKWKWKRKIKMKSIVLYSYSSIYIHHHHYHHHHHLLTLSLLITTIWVKSIYMKLLDSSKNSWWQCRHKFKPC